MDKGLRKQGRTWCSRTQTRPGTWGYEETYLRGDLEDWITEKLSGGAETETALKVEGKGWRAEGFKRIAGEIAQINQENGGKNDSRVGHHGGSAAKRERN